MRSIINYETKQQTIKPIEQTMKPIADHKCICLISMVFCILGTYMGAIAEPLLLWQKELDSRIIKTSDLGDFKATGTKGPQFPLKSVMTEKDIVVFDNKGKTKKRIPLKDYTGVALTDDGTTIAAMKGKRINIFTIDDQRLGDFEIAEPQPEIPPHQVFFELSPKGTYLVLISKISNTIYFYASEGTLLAKHQFPDTRGAEIKFSKDDKYTVIHLPNWGTGQSTGFLVCFKSKGEQSWRFDHEGCQAMFDISHDGETVILAAEDKLFALDKKGKVVYERQINAGDTVINLSDNGKYIALMEKSDRELSVIDVVKGKIVRSEDISHFNPQHNLLTSLDITSSGRFGLTSISKDWSLKNRKSTIYIYDFSSSHIWKHTFEKNRIYAQIAQHEGCLLIKSGNELMLYRL